MKYHIAKNVTNYWCMQQHEWISKHYVKWKTSGRKTNILHYSIYLIFRSGNAGTDSEVDVYLGLVIGEERGYVGGVQGNLWNDENSLYFNSVDGHKIVT